MNLQMSTNCQQISLINWMWKITIYSSNLSFSEAPVGSHIFQRLAQEPESYGVIAQLPQNIQHLQKRKGFVAALCSAPFDPHTQCTFHCKTWSFMDCFFTLGVKLSLLPTSVHFAVTLLNL